MVFPWRVGIGDAPGAFVKGTGAAVCQGVQAILGDLGVGGVGGSDGLSGAAVGGIIAAAVALLLLFLAALFMFVRRRRQQRERADATKDLDLGLMDHDSDSLDGGLKVSHCPPCPCCTPALRVYVAYMWLSSCVPPGGFPVGLQYVA